MKLHELKLQSPTLVEELNLVWADQDQLDEGVWDTLKTGYQQIANTVSQVKKSSNSKGELNDKVLRLMYTTELDKFQDAYTAAPPKVKAAVAKWLVKAGIRINGPDLSRKNLNRIVVLKVLRLVLFTVSQMRDNGIQWILSSVVTAGIGNIIGLLMNAKDVKDVGVEVVNTSKQLKTLFDKANEPPQGGTP